MKIDGMEIREDDREWNPIQPGRYFAIEVHTQQRGTFVQLEREPGRTNMSGEPRVSGWLGQTNNIDRHARGAVEVYKDAAGRRRVRHIDAEAAMAAFLEA